MSKRATKEHTAAILAEPSAIERLCSFISSGGTLTEWCALEGILYADTYSWVHADKARLSPYAAAQDARLDHLGDAFTSRLRDSLLSDVRQAYDEKGQPLAPHKLPDSIAHVADGAETETTIDQRTGRKKTTTRLRLVGKGRALELAGRRLGVFREQLAVDLNIGLAERLTAARKRVVGK